MSAVTTSSELSKTFGAFAGYSVTQIACYALGLVALIAELTGRSLTHRLDVGRRVGHVSYAHADYYPFLLAGVKIAVALMLARIAWRVAKAHAVVEGRDYVSPGDVKAVAEDVLSHRVILAPEARTAGIDAGDSIREALERTAIPV